MTDDTVYPKEYAHGYCFAVLCWGYTLTDFPISIRLTSLERLHNHNKAKHNKTVCIFLGIYCTFHPSSYKTVKQHFGIIFLGIYCFVPKAWIHPASMSTTYKPGLFSFWNIFSLLDGWKLSARHICYWNIFSFLNGWRLSAVFRKSTLIFQHCNKSNIFSATDHIFESIYIRTSILKCVLLPQDCKISNIIPYPRSNAYPLPWNPWPWNSD